MERYSKPKSPIEQAMDVCRPARFDPEGRDWRQPEMAALAAEIELDPRLAERRSKIEAIDSALATAIGQTPVPEGLAERLLARLQTAAKAAPLEPSMTVGPARPVEQVISLSASRPVQGRRHLARRRWLAGAVVAAAACLAGVWAWRPLGPLTYEQIVEAANLDAASPHDWKALSKGRALKGYPLSSDISARPLRWREARASWGGGVAYDIASRTGAKATLYVTPLNRVGGLDLDVPYRSPPNRPYMTGGKATAAWTDGKTLWVLVVEGGGGQYLSFAPNALA
jgi:hypothetical protein